MKNRNFILLVTAGVCTLIIASFIVSNLLFQNKGDIKEPDFKNVKIGARIARYLNNRTDSVLFTWSYNNSIINTNLSDLVGAYCDGVLMYGDLTNNTTNNVSLVGVFGQKTGIMNSSALTTIVDKFIYALEKTSTNSTLVTSWNDINPWPPMFWWDIAFDDSSSLSILYSKEQNMITAINGTWEMSEYGLNESTVIDFPHFEYNWEDDYYRAFLNLNDEGTMIILEAISIYLYQIVFAVA